MDRRRHERRSLSTVVAVHELDPHGTPQRPWRCLTTDISRSGIGLRARRMMHVGRGVFISLRMPRGRRKIVFGQVRYTSYESKGVYRVGVEFHQTPASTAIRRWLATQS